jgi:hypothetical protein
MMRRINISKLLMLFVGLSCLALTASQAAAQDSNEELNAGARKFDEFGPVGGCDLGARLSAISSAMARKVKATEQAVPGCSS